MKRRLAVVALIAVAGCSPDSKTPLPETPPDPNAEIYPFEVYESGEIGLKVRSCPTQDCEHVGTAFDGQALTAECASKSGFFPEGPEGGDEWLRIRWSLNTPTTGVGQSSPTEPHKAYVFRRYARPLGHNGEIRAC